jgi:hypothetical protein
MSNAAAPEARLGFWSATLATVFSLAYVIAQLAEWLGWLGSRGGPTNISTPLGLAVLLTPSLFLGVAFVVLLVSLHESTPPRQRVWSLTALAFGVAYAVLISMNYYVQLTLVAPRMAGGDIAGLEPFVFVPFRSFLYAVDILGYSFMCVAMLFAVPLFGRHGLDRAVRGFVLSTGLLLPFLALQMYFPVLIWIASLWAITFPGATWTLAIRFHRAKAPDLGGAVTSENSLVLRSNAPA